MSDPSTPQTIIPGDNPDLRVVLASGSKVRASMLRSAGVAIQTRTAGVDEAAVRDSMKAEGASTAHTATALAELKALHVSRAVPGAFVIGADQMLDCGGVWFEKAPDRDHARAQLQALRGRDHTLVSSAVVVRDGARIWHHVDQTRMTVLPFSDAFLDRYLDAAGEDILDSVGCYPEGLGAQLFSRVEGDFFTVLGLPLLPLLDFLRGHGILAR